MQVQRQEAPSRADEPAMLAAWLEFQRATVELKCAGLSPEQLAAQPVPPSNLSLLGLVLVIIMFLLVLAAPLIAPFDPLEQNIRDRMKPPGAPYLFGTDSFGRDVFSRVLYGGRLSLPLALVVAAGAGICWGANPPGCAGVPSFSMGDARAS